MVKPNLKSKGSRQWVKVVLLSGAISTKQECIISNKVVRVISVWAQKFKLMVKRDGDNKVLPD